MIKPAILPKPVPLTLVEQKSDFTAEGSPPPGKVGSTVPTTSADPPSAPLRRLRKPAPSKRPAAKGKR